MSGDGGLDMIRSFTQYTAACLKSATSQENKSKETFIGDYVHNDPSSTLCADALPQVDEGEGESNTNVTKTILCVSADDFDDMLSFTESRKGTHAFKSVAT